MPDVVKHFYTKVEQIIGDFNLMFDEMHFLYFYVSVK